MKYDVFRLHEEFFKGMERMIFKPLPSNHQWIKKKHFLLIKLLKLAKKITYSVMDNII